MIIGIDFDNTIIGYDELIYEIALERNLINPQTEKCKTAIRDSIRCLTDGEAQWQNVQAICYGEKILAAKPFKSAYSFICMCKKKNIPVYIVSHKTRYAAKDVFKIDLREKALFWLDTHGFILPNCLFENHIFFETTRIEKTRRIEALGCTHFIDDLEEFFLEKSFPKKTSKILFNPNGKHSSINNVLMFPSWDGINNYFFNV